jgi:hypothetical protein
MEVTVLVNVEDLRPSAADAELVAGLLDEVGEPRRFRSGGWPRGWVAIPTPDRRPRRRSWRAREPATAPDRVLPKLVSIANQKEQFQYVDILRF